MKHNWPLIALTLSLVVLFGCGYFLCCDIAHPRISTLGSMRSPGFYLPLMAAAIPLSFLAWRCHVLGNRGKKIREQMDRDLREMEARLNERLSQP